MSSATLTRSTPPLEDADDLIGRLYDDMATDLAEALDPVSLAERSGVAPDPWQAGVLRSHARQQILLCARQAGKSTVTSILAVHTALYEPGSLILMLSPGERQSKELLRKAVDAFKALGRPVATTTENTETIELANGSRIVALPGKEGTIRGYSGVRLLIVDEASRVDDALYKSVRPMLAVSGGDLVLLSTPFGKRGFFHHEWENGGDRWRRTKITAYDVPRIERAWLDAERAAIGDWWFEQEYLCEFVDTDDQFFASELITAAISADVTPLFAFSEVA